MDLYRIGRPSHHQATDLTCLRSGGLSRSWPEGSFGHNVCPALLPSWVGLENPPMLNFVGVYMPALTAIWLI